MKRKQYRNVEGFSLVELTVAMFVLTVGVLGGMTMIIMGMTRNNTNRVDTTATRRFADRDGSDCRSVGEQHWHAYGVKRLHRRSDDDQHGPGSGECGRSTGGKQY